MTTQDELVARIKARMSKDALGFEWHEYLEHLELDRFKQFAKPDADLSDMPPPKPIDREAMLAKMKSYMSFAFGKAHGERGISASRSVLHYVAWTWLAGDREFSDEVDRMGDTDYAPYGLPVLRRICAFYGWDPAELGDYR